MPQPGERGESVQKIDKARRFGRGREKACEKRGGKKNGGEEQRLGGGGLSAQSLKKVFLRQGSKKKLRESQRNRRGLFAKPSEELKNRGGRENSKLGSKGGAGKVDRKGDLLSKVNALRTSSDVP